ncbi:MAG: lytic transglycosylase domain-containing protein [Georgfuchsia sp.]
MSWCWRVVVVTFVFCANVAVAGNGDIFMRTLADGSVVLSNVPSEDNFELFMAAPDDDAVDMPEPNTTPDLALTAHVKQYRKLVAEAARQSEVDPRLLHAVIAIESGYNPQAKSAKGAIGLMQLMPDTARRYDVGNARDPLQNLVGGASYLHDLLKLFNNDVRLALAAYNAGENAVLRHGGRIPPYRETIAYVPKVMEVYRKLEKLLI